MRETHMLAAPLIGSVYLYYYLFMSHGSSCSGATYSTWYFLRLQLFASDSLSLLCFSAASL